MHTTYIYIHIYISKVFVCIHMYIYVHVYHDEHKQSVGIKVRIEFLEYAKQNK